MKKSIVKSAVLCASVLGLAMSANAAVINLNLTGASAEYTFWSAAAHPFLASLGCTAIQDAKTGKQGITMGTCNSGADTVYIRYASKASYDGVVSQKGIDPFNQTTCIDKSEREFADETLADFSTGAVNGTKCQQVTLGASDVNAGTFNQQSHGQLLGPLGGGQYDPSFSGIDASGLTTYNPIVVPFSFFKTIDVPTNNMTRLMATQIFGGTVADWGAFNPLWAGVPVAACLRHAGSGTHATLDAAVFRGEAKMSTTEDAFGFFGPVTYFNEGSSDLVRCLEWAHTNGYGAVGYSDVDKVLDVNGQIITDPANAVNGVMQMSYQGEQAVKSNIVNGVYDFWSSQWIFEDTCETMVPAPLGCTGGDDPKGVAAGGALHTYITQMMAFASDPANIALSGKGDFWAAQGEMHVSKASDWAWPTR